MMKNKNDNNEKESSDDSEPITLAELTARVEEQSRRVFESLLFNFRLGEVLSGVAWLFLISTFALEFFGYSYMIDDQTHRLTIGTLEQKNFRKELKKKHEGCQNDDYFIQNQFRDFGTSCQESSIEAK